MTSVTVDDSLADWKDIRGDFRNQRDLGLLLGNGASMALWRKFSYDSIYRIACDPALPHHLTPVDQAFFTDMDTVNFEAVLFALATTRMVCGHLKKDCADVDHRYNSIRNSLIAAVRQVHAPFKQVPTSVRRGLGDLLSRYRYIYTTNYDLLLYWAMMETSNYKWKDFLWGPEQSFNPSDIAEWNDPPSRVFFLHGGLHLCHDVLGGTKKRVFCDDTGDLLSQFDNEDGWIPLFVSEGKSKDKLRSIRNNDYLSFAYWKLCYHRGPMVVFGSALSKDHDQHILDAMRLWRQYDASRGYGLQRKVAISIYPKMSPTDIISLKTRLIADLNGCELLFYDSTTHPLGEPALAIPQPSSA